MKQHETIEQYLERNPEQAVTMNFSVSENLIPQIPRNEKVHRLRRLNLAVLNPTPILPLMSVRETNLPRDSPTPPDQSVKTSFSSDSAKEEDRHEDS